jgi:hypothetical protein
MIVRMFKPRFARLVLDGTKRQTVRRWPVRLPKIGETISLREWIGKPYRSKQRLLRESVVTGFSRVEIDERDYGRLWLGNTLADINAFAVADGFSDAHEFLDWFDAQYGLPFTGIVIHWQ